MEVVRKFEFRGKQFLTVRAIGNTDRIVKVNDLGNLMVSWARYAPYSSDQINRAIIAMRTVQVVDGLPTEPIEFSKPKWQRG